MADFKDVMEAHSAACDIINILDEEAPINKTVAVGFSAVALAILAAGIRVEVALNHVTASIRRS